MLAMGLGLLYGIPQRAFNDASPLLDYKLWRTPQGGFSTMQQYLPWYVSSCVTYASVTPVACHRVADGYQYIPTRCLN